MFLRTSTSPLWISASPFAVQTACPTLPSSFKNGVTACTAQGGIAGVPTVQVSSIT